MHLFKKKNVFPNFFFFFFFFAFSKFRLILSFFEKKMTLKADVFLNLWTRKNVGR